MWVLAVLGPSAAAPRDERMADQAALVRLARGDQSALAELYDRHARPIYSLALRILREQADAEDIVQEVFAQAWNQAARFNSSRGAVAAWLLMMARSRAIDRLRFDQRKKRVNTYPHSLGPTTDIVDPQQACLFEEQSRLLRNALEVLTPEERKAIENAFFSELTYEQTARKLNQPLGTVKTRIRSGLGKLREAMGKKLKAE